MYPGMNAFTPEIYWNHQERNFMTRYWELFKKPETVIQITDLSHGLIYLQIILYRN
jgi:hypothetical protein